MHRLEARGTAQQGDRRHRQQIGMDRCRHEHGYDVTLRLESVAQYRQFPEIFEFVNQLDPGKLALKLL
jgi:hypothetical protein